VNARFSMPRNALVVRASSDPPNAILSLYSLDWTIYRLPRDICGAPLGRRDANPLIGVVGQRLVSYKVDGFYSAIWGTQ
jgi:hypothetical protein